MRCPTRKSPAGFTLIEILIVVIILGILAAIVIPRFADSSAAARQSTLVTTVRTIRTQVLLYRLEHGDQLPNLAQSSAEKHHFRPLLQATTYDGRTRGPYLVSIPVNPNSDRSRVRDAVTFNAAGLPDPVPDCDFIFDYGGGNGSGLIWGTTDRASGTPVPQ